MLIWFIAGLVLLGVELLTFGLISIWFALGAFLTMPFYNLALEHQFYIFVGTSLLSLILVRKIALKYFKTNSKELNRITEKEVTIEDITLKGNQTFYTVYLDGKIWEAISSDDFKIGENAIVQKIVGNKLFLIKKL
ncbi:MULTISPECIES: NfeD family protein [unclassified Cetobacterium]|uniref:NfeD family protein n=1 Tax=unclassified Cetobacterium TaxID=2630983 RepID=UPI00068B5133|nr:NfeD family protein [Cetobacterium sp. ZOR0034]